MRKVTKMDSNADLSTTGKRIEYLRREKELSQQQLAEQLSIKRELLNMIEADSRPPNIDMVKSLAKILGTTADFLLCLSDASTTNTDMRYITDTTGLSEQVVTYLANYTVEVERRTADGMRVYGIEKAKLPDEVNQIILSPFFNMLFTHVWLLNNLRRDDKFFPSNLKMLRNLMSVQGFRKYLINNVQNILVQFLDKVAPYEPQEGDNDWDARFTDYRDIGMLNIESYMYMSKKEGEPHAKTKNK